MVIKPRKPISAGGVGMHSPELSLRYRIALSYMIATAVMIALVFSLIYLMVNNIVYRHIDQELHDEVEELLGDTRSADCRIDVSTSREWSEREHTRADVDPIFLQLTTPGLVVIKKSANMGDIELRLDRAIKQRLYSNGRLAGLPVRQLQEPIFDKQGNVTGYLAVAETLKSAFLVFRDLRMILLLSFPGILLVLFFLTRVIVGKSMKPVEEVIAIAERITRDNLDQRIELPSGRDELYRLSSTINELLDRLQEAFVREKNFTSDASHELKTPLAAVMGTLEVLIRKPRDVEHYEQRVAFCIRELARMSGLIDQLLMLARYDSGTVVPDFKKVDLLQLVSEVVNRSSASVEQRTVSLRSSPPSGCMVYADPAMLDVMIENILSNALKYSLPEAGVAVTVEDLGSMIICAVSDHGIGIAEEKLPYIFDRFYRTDESRNSKTSGSGLGLSIVKKLADLQKIKVSVSSKLHEGTTVTMTFQRTTPRSERV